MTYRTGTASPASMIRGLADRLRALESRQRYSLGSWRLEEGPTGHLVATHVPTGRTAVLATAYDPEREEA